MRKHYSQVIWGIIFIFININIGPIDILPNFLGYIFIAYGLSGLEQVNPFYRKGIKPSLVLALASFIFIFYPINTAPENISPSNCWMLGIIPAFSVLNLVIFYSICKGIYKEFEKIANNDLMHSAEIGWKCMFYFTCISLILTPFTLTIGQNLMWLNFLISVILVILAFLIVLLLWKARSELCQDIL